MTVSQWSNIWVSGYTYFKVSAIAVQNSGGSGFEDGFQFKYM